MYKTGLVFGVFDGLHQGHKNFLTQAAGKCEELFVVVTVPEVVKLLKGRLPRLSYVERIKALAEFNPRLKTIPSEKTIGTWKILAEVRPDIIMLGYDQQAIARELEKIKAPHIFLKPHYSKKYKSSLLN